MLCKISLGNHCLADIAICKSVNLRMAVHLFWVTESFITSVTCVGVHLIAFKYSSFVEIKMGHHMHKFVVLVTIQKKIHSVLNGHETRIGLTEAGLSAIGNNLMFHITIVTDV